MHSKLYLLHLLIITVKKSLSVHVIFILSLYYYVDLCILPAVAWKII